MRSIAFKSSKFKVQNSRLKVQSKTVATRFTNHSPLTTRVTGRSI